MASAENEKSVIWVIVMAMLLVSAFGWAFAAAGYAHNVEGWRTGGFEGQAPGGIRSGSRRALADFVMNAVRQIPNAPQVIGFTLRHRLWLVVLFIALEGLVLLGGYMMRRLEQKLSSPPTRRTRR